MKAGIALILCFAFCAATTQAAQLYKWIDADGKVHYTEQPPPAGAKSIQQKKLGDKPTESALPYALQQAVKNHPVILYNTGCGEPCTKATELLNKRGVPFIEKNAESPSTLEELKKLLGGTPEVPVLRVGSTTLRGLEEAEWNNALDLAGYPKTSLLPPKTATKRAETVDPTVLKSFPVTLYNADCGELCTKARQLLVKRGVPFTEKNPQEPEAQEALQKLFGNNVVIPVLKVGNMNLQGFDEAQWDSALDFAGYPKTASPSPGTAAKQSK